MPHPAKSYTLFTDGSRVVLVDWLQTKHDVLSTWTGRGWGEDNDRLPRVISGRQIPVQTGNELTGTRQECLLLKGPLT